MKFNTGQLVEYAGIKQRKMSILVGDKFIRECHTAVHGELFLFIRYWGGHLMPFEVRVPNAATWGVFLVGDQYVVERCHCFYPLKSQALYDILDVL